MINEILVEPQHVAWLPWAASYFFFIGLAATAVAGAVMMRYVKQASSQQELIAVAVALTCAIVAPIALTADLHQPTRVWHFYTVLTYWSLMWWGAYILPFFTMTVAAYFLLLFYQVKQPMTAKLAARLAIWLHWVRGLVLISVAAILFYTCMEVYQVQARPLWHNPWFAPLIIFSALPTSMLLIQWTVKLRTQQNLAYLRHWALFSLTLFILALIGLCTASGDIADQLTQLYQQKTLPIFTAVFALVIAGWLLLPPFRFSLGLSVIFALIFTGMVRWVLFIQVQTLAKYNALANPYHFEWNADGGLGMLSMLGLWALVSVLMWQLLNMTKTPTEQKMATLNKPHSTPHNTQTGVLS
ncbi:NrfD/PsrC family molybdoenzyme membrane anchor subunit [Lonepinella koalarum]|uniref:NrfD/PsrC family molybdoenzyme membrane anchor subunit n=1 Tax=Lonepinella koalarum TaxID=53417 RepID=UPI003F6DFBCD